MPEAKKLLDLDGVLGAFEGLSEDPEKPGKKRLRVDDALQAFDAIAAPEPPTPEEEEEPTGLRRKLPPRAGLFTAMFPEDELREKRQPLLGQIGERFVQGLVRNPVFPP